MSTGAGTTNDPWARGRRLSWPRRLCRRDDPGFIWGWGNTRSLPGRARHWGLYKNEAGETRYGRGCNVTTEAETRAVRLRGRESQRPPGAARGQFQWRHGPANTWLPVCRPVKEKSGLTEATMFGRIFFHWKLIQSFILSPTSNSNNSKSLSSIKE